MHDCRKHGQSLSLAWQGIDHSKGFVKYGAVMQRTAEYKSISLQPLPRTVREVEYTGEY